MKKLLIVEQEPVLLEILEHRLRADGWDTAGCGEGKKAMELLTSFQPDILLTNILIPFFSGIELLQFTKKNYPKTSVIILALLAHDIFQKQAMELGADLYLTKPFDLEKLVENIQQVYFKNPSLHQ